MRIMQVVLGSQILFLQLVFSALTSVSAHCMCHSSVLVVFHSMSLFKYFKIVDIISSLPDPKGQRIVIDRDGGMHHVHARRHCSTSLI